MNLKFPYLFVLIFVALLCSSGCNKSDSSHHIAGNLKCEYMKNPIGLDTPKPRFTWQMYDETSGAKQKAYQLLVGKDSASLSKGKADIWDSGKILSDKILVSYDGEELEALSKYFWTVRIWNENNNPSDYDELASFETGMMNANRWQADWISDSEDIVLKPAPFFRKEFNIDKEVVSARAYIASAGLHELYINGKKLGDARLTPAYTRFDKRILYITHDITALIKKENAVGVLLGNGWYNHQSTAVWDFHKAPWRAHPKFMMEVHLTYKDGTKEIIPTSTDWRTSLSHVIFNSIYTGEHIDNRLYQKDWNQPGFNDQNWENAIEVKAPSENIVAEIMPAIKNNEAIAVKSLTKIDDQTYVFDLGRNIAGVSELKVTGEQGTIIRLKHGEQLADNGHVDLTSLEVHYRPLDDTDPFQTDIFILHGDGEETFMPYFNYKGFQYVEITSSKPISLTKSSLTGYFMHSDVEKIGFIHSSDTLLNKIWEATNNSYLSNLFGYPTDCPQREKNGWTGDPLNAVEMGLFNYNSIKVFEKWMDDHRDEQRTDGVLPAIIPTSGWGYHWANGPDWTSTIAHIPWFFYLYNGDIRILEENYERIKLYVNHLSEISPNHLTDWGLGDWIPIKSESSLELTSSIYFYSDALILSKIAKILNDKDDAEKYLTLANKVKNAINEKFLDQEKGIYASGFQTELSLSLFWGVVPEEMIKKVAGNLAKAVKDNGTQLDVGLLGSRAILDALSKNGYADLAYELASNKEYPSWGWWIANGATTLYENWDINSKNDLSLNHIMFGEISAWYYKTLGGINIDENQPGFKNIILKPNFVEGLNDIKASHFGPFGEIVSEWERLGDKIEYSVKIPANSTATLYLDAEEILGLENYKFNISKEAFLSKIELPSGSYKLVIKCN